MADNPAIAASQEIWREHHEQAGITLAESARDWRGLLDEDPTMQLTVNWGDLARAVTEEQIAEFREWLNEQIGEVNALTSEDRCDRHGLILDCGNVCRRCRDEADRG